MKNYLIFLVIAATLLFSGYAFGADKCCAQKKCLCGAGVCCVDGKCRCEQGKCCLPGQCKCAEKASCNHCGCS